MRRTRRGETPALAAGDVIAFVELAPQIVASLALDLLGIAEEQTSRCAVRLLVDFMDHAVEYGHYDYLGQAPPSVTGCAAK